MGYNNFTGLGRVCYRITVAQEVDKKLDFLQDEFGESIIDKSTKTVIIGPQGAVPYDMYLDKVWWRGPVSIRWKNTVTIDVGYKKDSSLKLRWMSCAGDEPDSECGRQLAQWNRWLSQGGQIKFYFSTETLPSSDITPNRGYVNGITKWEFL